MLVSAMTDSGNQNASHYILGPQWWSMIEWWISNVQHCKRVSGVLNRFARAMQSSSRGEEGVSKVLEIVNKEGRQGKYIYRLGVVFLIRQHHLGCYSARKQFAWHHLSALIRRLNA